MALNDIIPTKFYQNSTRRAKICLRERERERGGGRGRERDEGRGVIFFIPR